MQQIPVLMICRFFMDLHPALNAIKSPVFSGIIINGKSNNVNEKHLIQFSDSEMTSRK